MPPPRGCLVCGAIGSAICLAIGLGMAIGGAVTAGLASERDAATDFRELEGQCTIAEAWVTRRETKSDKKYECWDDWDYHFCLPGAETKVVGLNSTCTPMYQSKKDSIKVCEGRCSSCGGGTTPKFQVNEAVECWEPAPGYDPGFPYDCGNPPCYKIFDPAVEVAAAMIIGAILTPLGVIFLAIAIGIAVFVGCMCKRQSNQPPPPAATYNPQPGVAMVPVATATAQLPNQMPVAQPMGMAVAQPVGAPPMAVAQPMAMPVAQPSAYPQAAGYPQATGYPTAAGYPKV